MLISENTKINASADTVWSHLRTLEGAEQYIPMVTRAEVKGGGLGAIRTCDVQMGDQSFQLMETLVKLDDSQKELVISIDDAPPPMKDLKIHFTVLGNDNFSELKIRTEIKQTPENAKMIEGILNMISSGLKQYHEKQS